jgi:hypothetical protein
MGPGFPGSKYARDDTNIGDGNERKEKSMSFGKAVLAAFIGGVLAGVFLLAYRVSQQTDKSITESFVDVPGEARKVYVDVKAKATDAVKHMRETGEEAEEAVTAEWPESGYVQGGTVEP